MRDAQVAAELEDMLEQKAQLELHVEEVDALITAETLRLEEKRQEAARVATLRQQLVDELGQAKERRSALRSRQELLEDLQRRMEGVGAGVRMLLDRKRLDGAPAEVDGLIGMVADVFEADVSHAPIVEAVIGEHDQSLVVSTSSGFLRHVETLGELPGRLNVICLDRLPPLLNERDFSDQPGFVARAIELVGFQERFEHLARHLFGKTIVVEDLAVGVRMDKVVLIRGSGVDLSHYPLLPEPAGTPVVAMASRLLIDKGVVEFVEAARILRARGVSARFQLIGDLDPGNPASVSAETVRAWQKEGVVECLGFRSYIPALFLQAHVVALPSYREGLPKVLIEAAASGRAVVTTDMPGCRDAIEPDVTGLLVPARDTQVLVQALGRLIEDSALRQRMGQAGRALAEREFGIEKVVDAHLAIYRELVGVDREQLIQEHSYLYVYLNEWAYVKKMIFDSPFSNISFKQDLFFF